VGFIQKGVLFATATTPVDTNTVMRQQYKPVFYSTPVSPKMTDSTIRFYGKFDFSGYDVRSYDTHVYNGKTYTANFYDMGVQLFILPASVLPEGYAPQYDDFNKDPYYKSVKSYRATPVVRQNGGTGYVEPDNTVREYKITGPAPGALAPNAKYWAMVSPVRFRRGQPVDTAVHIMSPRIVSFWTNRTPEAPTITSPPTGAVVNSGADVTFAFKTPDAGPGSDKVFGNGDEVSYADCAGIQIQYAPRPTPENPNPEWIDLPWTMADGSGTNPGWIIYRSAYQPGTGIYNTWINHGGLIRAGANAIVADRGMLPSGEWQLRMRTFDWGHPFPVNAFAWGKGPYNTTDFKDYADIYPGNAPAANTSPWSKVVFLTVSAQVPPPIPLAPVSNVAIPFGRAVTLLWQYRNTAQVPQAQASRTVQMRKVGETNWTTLVSGNSSSTSYTVDQTAYPLAEHTQYEWRVQVTDAQGVVSNYSTTARFWIVPAPASGIEKVVPDGTLDGASLGCGKQRAFIYLRGGMVRVAEVKNPSHVDWERKRDEISTAEVQVVDWDIDCGNLLSRLRTWAYELVIFRDNGYGNERVWEGPITLLTYERDKVTIQAKDVMAYAYRRILKQEMNDQGVSVVDRAARVLQNCIGPDDPNVLQWMQPLMRSDDAKQYRKTPAYSRTAYEEVDDMAANSGLDYTVVGRAILLWGTKHRIGTLPEFRDEDLGSTPIVSEYGMSMANYYAVSDGNGTYGTASRLDANGKDPENGLVEMLSSTWAQDAEQETGTYTEEGLETVRKSFAEFAERSIADRYPTPVVVRVPDGTSLNPDTVINIQQLVPGVAIPLRSVGTLREVRTTQKLDSIKVIQEGDNEMITVTMSAFTRDDASQEVAE
jgi:hypothetical protein